MSSKGIDAATTKETEHQWILSKSVSTMWSTSTTTLMNLHEFFISAVEFDLCCYIVESVDNHWGKDKCEKFQLVYPESPAMLNVSGELVLRDSFLFTSHFFNNRSH